VSTEKDRTEIFAPEDARREIEGLVERFARNLDVYTRPDYKETQVRVEFIDPFFEALGWDVRNVRGYAEQYKDVVHEDAIKVSGATQAPDYCFRVGGVRKFFLEAKKPSTPVKGDVGPAYQLRRYAWSAKLPLSILTDFEEFAVYDCRQRPKPTDKAGVGRVLYYTFDQYLDRLDQIYGIFARDSVLKGSFDRYVLDTRGKRGTSEVDVEFLKEIEGWREELARNIALRNADLSVHELNFAVQRTIDRVIFLRMCEDRGIEGYGRLLALTAGPHIYDRMGELYREADEKYNSDLFDFRADTLTKSLTMDDKTLKPILAGLYYPDCPYEFSVLPTEILGQVYEQFLGKVIRLTAGHRAKVEEKPEVKKAGGVYYTPSYIVGYIVEQTVGRLIEGKTPQQISKLRILDPACGSGSFLLGAYQRLLDYHRQWYEEHEPQKQATAKRPTIYQGRGGEWRLTTGEKKRLLLNNIYGVDIDRQAVEVTKLSLLLRVLEGENQETLGQQLRLWRERALPDLGENIKCGNSLIGPDYFEGQLIPDEEEMRRVNAFDWDKEFPEIMKPGGFDAVIGNPPYVRAVRIRTEKKYYKESYVSAFGAYDIYILFMEKALDLLCDKGIVGFITPNKYFVADYAKQLRHHLLTEASISEIADLGKCRSVFAGALISTAITFFTKAKPSEQVNLKILSDSNVHQISEVPPNIVQRNEIVTREEIVRVYQNTRVNAILSKLSREGEPLSDVAQVRTGVMGFDYWALDKYVSDTNQGRRIATNSYVDRYTFLWGKQVRVYKRKVFEPRLAPDCDVLSNRTLELFALNKIVIRGVARRLTAVLDEEGIAILVAVHAVVGKRYDNKFLLGLLNSKLFNWIHLIQFYSARIPEGSLRYPISFLARLPIRTIDFEDPHEVALYHKLVALVERMLDLHKKLHAATIPAEKKLYQRQIEATDQEIDALVYELYGLTEEEIAIVEERD